MARRCIAFALVLSAMVLGVVAPARAAIDMTGRWVEQSFLICLDVVQSGSTLTALRCDGTEAPFSGSIDPLTGVFTLGQPPVCGHIELSGTVAPDGNSFAATSIIDIYHCTFLGCGCFDFGGPTTGLRARCGDNYVDPDAGEACEPYLSFGCCSPTCQYQPSGMSCDSDLNACTLDQCDGAGTCTHYPGHAGEECRPAAGPCNPAEVCTGFDYYCPPDGGTLPDGAACEDGDPCTAGETCTAGICGGGQQGSCVPGFKCYKAKDLRQPRFALTNVTLADQFGSAAATLEKPRLLCNPAEVDGAPIVDPSAHLACYQLAAGAPAVGAHVEVSNALGVLQLEVRKPALLCAPSTKTILP